MRYKNENDNNYRVNFMRATEELMDNLTVKEFISFLQENAIVEEEQEDDPLYSSFYLDKKFVQYKTYEYKEPNSNLRKEFAVTEDGRVFYLLSLIHKVELVDAEEKEEKKMQVVDLREVKDTVKEVISEVKKEDDNWSWKADVLKNEIRVWWGYLQYCDTKDSHFTIRMGTIEEGNIDNDFITARDEHDRFITGALIGSESYCDGDLAKCVAKMIRALASVAHRCY